MKQEDTSMNIQNYYRMKRKIKENAKKANHSKLYWKLSERFLKWQ